MKVDLKIAEVRTLGVAHWEHELKKAYNVISCGNEKMCNALQGGINDETDRIWFVTGICKK